MALKKTNLFKRGKVYYLRYRGENGKLVMKSLKTSNRVDAESEKKRILENLRGLKRELDIIHAKEKTLKTYSSKSFPISIIWQEFEKELKRQGSSKDSSNRYKFRINQFTNWIDEQHKEITKLAGITDDTAKTYADWLSDTDISNKTYNETLNALKRTIDVFKEQSGIAKNPFRKENIPRRDKAAFSRKEFTEAETMKLLNSFQDIKVLYKDEVEVLFYLGVFAGLRMKDAALLQWDSVDFNSNNIYLTPSKTRKYKTRVKIPLHPALKEKLYNAKNWQTDNYIMPTLANRYNRNRNNIKKYVTAVIEANNFKTTIDKKNTEDTRKHAACLYGFHSLRYTFVSVCAKAGIPATLVQDIVGHQNPAMTKHYTRFDDKYRQQQINKFNIGMLPEGNKTKIQQITEKLNNADDEQLSKILEILNKSKSKIL